MDKKILTILILLLAGLFLLGCTGIGGDGYCGDGICQESELLSGDCPSDCGVDETTQQELGVYEITEGNEIGSFLSYAYNPVNKTWEQGDLLKIRYTGIELDTARGEETFTINGIAYFEIIKLVPNGTDYIIAKLSVPANGANLSEFESTNGTNYKLAPYGIYLETITKDMTKLLDPTEPTKAKLKFVYNTSSGVIVLNPKETNTYEVGDMSILNEEKLTLTSPELNETIHGVLQCGEWNTGKSYCEVSISSALVNPNTTYELMNTVSKTASNGTIFTIKAGQTITKQDNTLGMTINTSNAIYTGTVDLAIIKSKNWTNINALKGQEIYLRTRDSSTKIATTTITNDLTARFNDVPYGTYFPVAVGTDDANTVVSNGNNFTFGNIIYLNSLKKIQEIQARTAIDYQITYLDNLGNYVSPKDIQRLKETGGSFPAGDLRNQNIMLATDCTEYNSILCDNPKTQKWFAPPITDGQTYTTIIKYVGTDKNSSEVTYTRTPDNEPQMHIDIQFDIGKNCSTDNDCDIIGICANNGECVREQITGLINANEITTCEELQTIKDNPNANYVLMNDIDCTGFSFTKEESSIIMNAQIDGLNHTIINLDIVVPQIN